MIPESSDFALRQDQAAMMRGGVQQETNDTWNYALLLVLYTLQGIPMGLSASIPFLLQQKIKNSGTSAAAYRANAIFALCTWPFSLKLLWAPIVDAVYWKRNRRKSWLVPVQILAGLLMVGGAGFVQEQLDGVGDIQVQGLTAFFFCLYFLMATQDIAVDGWALTMLSKKNRGRGPVCNSIGQNIGYFLSFVGFLALNDIESSETLWRPLLGLPSDPTRGIISLQGFLKSMGVFMLATTAFVAVFKKEGLQSSDPKHKDDDGELDASEIGLIETYKRLWAVCKLPAVRWLFVILFTYRLPTALADNVKFLKAVEFGLSKSTTALLSPTVILPLGILVPLVATKIWHSHPLSGQFMTAYKLRVTLAPMFDMAMLWMLQQGKPESITGLTMFWGVLIMSTAGQAIVNSLQFNAQMTFFARRVDPAIGGSYMTLLNTAANLGGTWPASFIMWVVSQLSVKEGSIDPYYGLQIALSLLGCAWIFFFQGRVNRISSLPEEAWRTHRKDGKKQEFQVDIEAVPVQTDDGSVPSSTARWWALSGSSEPKVE